MHLDHFVLAAPDLARAKEEFADLSGCMPADGGAHVGLGTHNALCSFGATSYLEIIAPDPDQAREGAFAALLAQLRELTPLHYAVQTKDLQAVARAASAQGWAAGPIRDTSRRQPDGQLLSWQLMGIKGHDLAGLVPFFIDWQASPHPAQHTPVAGQLRKFQITTEEPALARMLSGVEGIDVTQGPNTLAVAIDTPKGTLHYSATTLKGFTL
jgi:hypothetical protein